MIKIVIKKVNNQTKSISLKGHATYADYGQDIVCAAVSATYLCTLRAILSINSASISTSSKNNEEKIVVIKEDNLTEKLLNNMVDCLQDVQLEYPKHIRIDKEEI